MYFNIIWLSMFNNIVYRFIKKIIFDNPKLNHFFIIATDFSETSVA